MARRPWRRGSASMPPSHAAALAMGAGARGHHGREWARRRAAMKLALRTGFGAAATTGPWRDASWRAKRTDLTASSAWIQLTHWLPEPAAPPRPARMSGARARQMPPRSERMKPKRRATRRISGMGAAKVSDSHVVQTSAQKPVPGREDSVQSASPVLPNHATELAWIHVSGGEEARRTASARARTTLRRDWRMAARLDLVKRHCVLRPARLMTAVAPSRALVHEPKVRASQWMARTP